jgi:predicted DNA-binding transcriptional regulator YafY
MATMLDQPPAQTAKVASIDPELLVTIDYTNYRGERGLRRVRPIRIIYSATNWHKEAQWLLEAFDTSRGADRLFALKDIHSWAAGPILSTGRR